MDGASGWLVPGKAENGQSNEWPVPPVNLWTVGRVGNEGPRESLRGGREGHGLAELCEYREPAWDGEADPCTSRGEETETRGGVRPFRPRTRE